MPSIPRAALGLLFFAGVGCVDVESPTARRAERTREPETRDAPQQGSDSDAVAQPRVSEAEPDAPRCDHLACAIGLSPADVDFGRGEVGRVGGWVELEGGVWYFVRDGIITRLRLRPCSPLRGDLRTLEELGFVLRDPRRIGLTDASGITGIEGHWLEGRGHSCVITRSTHLIGRSPRTRSWFAGTADSAPR